MIALPGQREGSENLALDFVDRIYEASVVPSLWPSLLADIAREIDCDGGAIVADRLGDVQWITSPGGGDAMRAIVQSPLGRTALFARRLLHSNYMGFTSDRTVIPAEIRKEDAFYTDLILKLGIGETIGSVIRMPNDEDIIIYFVRAVGRPPVEVDVLLTLDSLRPHLARSILMALEVGLNAAQATEHTLDGMGLPAAIIGRRGRVLMTNDHFEELVPDVVIMDKNGIKLAHSPSDDALNNLLAAKDGLVGARSIPVPRRMGRFPKVVHLLPVRGVAADIFAGARWTLLVTRIKPLDAPSPHELGILFDLSPAEARAASLRAGGFKVPDIAEEIGVSQETIKSQLKSACKKLGLSGGQSDLIRTISGMLHLPGDRQRA